MRCWSHSWCALFVSSHLFLSSGSRTLLTSNSLASSVDPHGSNTSSSFVLIFCKFLLRCVFFFSLSLSNFFFGPACDRVRVWLFACCSVFPGEFGRLKTKKPSGYWLHKTKKNRREVNGFLCSCCCRVYYLAGVCGLWRDLLVYLSENKRSWDSDAWLVPPVVCVSAIQLNWTDS